MKKSCKKGYYYCFTSKKCKKIPAGHHVMGSGRLMKDSEHEENNGGEESTETTKNGKTNGNGNGNGGNGGAVSEGWSEKYKKSIDCKNPKGFSQRAHCQGRKVNEAKEKDHEVSMAKTQVKKSIDNLQKVAKVLAKKTDADNLPAWVQSKLTDTEHNTDAAASYMTGKEDLDEGKRDGKSAKDKDYSLRDWFKGGGWVQAGGKYDGKPCAKQPGQKTKPFCRDADDRAAMSKEERNKRAKKKRKEDPNPDRKGKAKMVREQVKPVKIGLDPKKYGAKNAEDLLKRITGGVVVPLSPTKSANVGEEIVLEKKDACYKKVKARYDVWPSAYASGALVKCRKVGAANWGTKSESFQYSNWREDFKALEIETIDLIKAEPLMNEGLAKAALIGGAALAGKVIYDRIRKSTDTHSDESIGQPTIQGAASAIRKRNEALNKLNQQLNQSHELEGEVVNEYKEGDKIEYSKDTQELINRANETSIQKLTRRARQTKNSIELKAPRNPLTLPEAKNDPCWVGYTQKGMKKKGGKMVPNCVKEGYSNWRQELDEDWQKVNKGDKTDGMSQKAVDAYKRENPGSKLKTAVTEKNPTGKRAERRKNFCSRSDGQRKMHNIDCSKTPDKAICKARKRWRC